MSSKHYDSRVGDIFGPEKAFDGIYIPELAPSAIPAASDVQSMTHSENHATVWIEVDLEQTYTVVAVNILNRACKFN